MSSSEVTKIVDYNVWMLVRVSVTTRVSRLIIYLIQEGNIVQYDLAGGDSEFWSLIVGSLL